MSLHHSRRSNKSHNLIPADGLILLGRVSYVRIARDRSLDLSLLLLHRLRLFVNLSDRSGDVRLVHDREKETAFTNSGLNRYNCIPCISASNMYGLNLNDNRFEAHTSETIRIIVLF